MAVQAVALLSGGLDSALAIALVREQGVEVEALHFVSVFNGGAPEQSCRLRAKRVAGQLGVKATMVPFTRDQLRLVKDPPHGYGSAMNPCIDCHMAMLRRAAERLRDGGPRFIVSGEVVGQRPMSQRAPVLRRIDRETGLGGLILRPLSAKLLPPTLPEQEGWVDRERLLDIRGRSRKRQLELAARYGLTEFATPAGGCLLTDKGFGARLRDLLEETGELDLGDVHLLKVGRHFRLGPATRAVVGRNERENGVIVTFSRRDDLLLTTRDAPGPATLVRGEASDAHVRTAAALTARYSKLRGEPAVAIAVGPGRGCQAAHVIAGGEPSEIIDVGPIDDAEAARLRIQ